MDEPQGPVPASEPMELQAPPAEVSALFEVTPPKEEPAEVAVSSSSHESETSAPEATYETPVPNTTAPSSPTIPAIDSARGNAAKKQKIEHRLEQILAEARKKKQITNRDVVNLLRISDATASRYLKMLVARGQLQKSGRGRSVVYTI